MTKKSDYDEVSPERRAELHKRAQEVMRESRLAKEVKRRLPHLLSVLGGRHCSICKMPFPPDTKPSVNEAFAQHVLKAHRPAT
jgi:hypothetical protein